jgi:hypothetical protein
LYDRPECQLSVELRTADGTTPKEAKYFVFDRTDRSWKQSGGFSGKMQRDIDLHSELRRTPDHRLGLIVFADGYAVPAPIEIVTAPKLKPVVVDLQPAPMGALRGRVVDAAGSPVAGAALGLSLSLAEDVVSEPWRYVSNVPEQPPVTDAEGRFALPGLHRGSQVALYVNKDGCAGVWSDRVTIGQSGDVTLPDLRLVPATRSIQGQVVDEDKQPLANARVRVHDFSRRETKTDTSGRFVLAEVPAGDLILVAVAAGYDDIAKRFSAEQVAAGVMLQLRRDADQFLPSDEARVAPKQSIENQGKFFKSGRVQMRVRSRLNRDSRGVLRDESGRPVGFWGVDTPVGTPVAPDRR